MCLLITAERSRSAPNSIETVYAPSSLETPTSYGVYLKLNNSKSCGSME